MKGIIRNIIFYSVSLYVLSQLVSGVHVSGGFMTYLLGGAVLSVMFIIVKPILNVISIPLNLITLGMFSFFSNVILLLLLTMFVPEIKISAFLFHGFSYSGFTIPRADVNLVFAYIVSGVVLSAIITFLTWLIRK